MLGCQCRLTNPGAKLENRRCSPPLLLPCSWYRDATTWLYKRFARKKKKGKKKIELVVGLPDQQMLLNFASHTSSVSPVWLLQPFHYTLPSGLISVCYTESCTHTHTMIIMIHDTRTYTALWRHTHIS